MFHLKWMIFYANQLMSLSYIKEILDKDIPKCKTFNNLKSLKTKEWDVL
jgi:phage FluMu protein Com